MVGDFQANGTSDGLLDAGGGGPGLDGAGCRSVVCGVFVPHHQCTG
jgi:hypothetical protein